MKIDKYIVIILFLLIVIYFSQDVLYSGGGSPIAQVSLFLVFSISGFYWIKIMKLRKGKSLFFSAWTFLLFLNIFGYIFTADFSFYGHYHQFKTILMVSLVFYPFYYFSRKGVLKSKHLIWFYLIMLPIIIGQYYFQMNQILTRREFGNINIVNNTAYTFVFFLPYLFLLKRKKILSMLLAFVMLLFIIQGAKRGAMIIGAIGVILFAYYQLKTLEKKNRYKGFILVVIGFTALVYFGYEYFQRNEYLIVRLSSIGEGDSSGRNIIYFNLFNTWANSDSIINILFGYGYGSSIKLSGTGNWAHNDWLELLINFGILGVIIYTTIFFSAIRFTLSKKCNTDKRILMLTVLIIWFFTSMVSMNYNGVNSVFQSILLAYLLGNISCNIE